MILKRLNSNEAHCGWGIHASWSPGLVSDSASYSCRTCDLDGIALIISYLCIVQLRSIMITELSGQGVEDNFYSLLVPMGYLMINQDTASSLSHTVFRCLCSLHIVDD